jgi:type II secretory pathway pseudopilin PulG
MRWILAALLLIVCFVPAVGQDRISRADRTKMRETREAMRALQLDLSTYQQIHEAFPDELKALVTSNLRDEVPKDGWGREFSYATAAERGYRLISLGADGKVGGDGGNADITFDSTGEVRTLTKDELAARATRREAQRLQGLRLVARQRMVALGAALVSQRRTDGKWPETLEVLRKPGNTPPDLAFNRCMLDPWGREFALRLLPHENFAVVCWGADGEEGGTGLDGDFVITERDVRAGVTSNRREAFWGWGMELEHDWQARALANDVFEYKKRFGKLPNELEDLMRAGTDADGKAIAPVRSHIPRDKWENEYVFVRLSEDEFYVAGLGKDGLEGGAKDNRDTLHPKPGEVFSPEPRWDDDMDVPFPMPEPDEMEEDEMDEDVPEPADDEE